MSIRMCQGAQMHPTAVYGKEYCHLMGQSDYLPMHPINKAICMDRTLLSVQQQTISIGSTYIVYQQTKVFDLPKINT